MYLVEMEHRRVAPINRFICSECGKEIKLRRTRGNDETGTSVFSKRVAQLRACGMCCGFARFAFGCCFENIHVCVTARRARAYYLKSYGTTARAYYLKSYGTTARAYYLKSFVKSRFQLGERAGSFLARSIF